jgi:hypothetical protein
LSYKLLSFDLFPSNNNKALVEIVNRNTVYLSPIYLEFIVYSSVGLKHELIILGVKLGL